MKELNKELKKIAKDVCATDFVNEADDIGGDMAYYFYEITDLLNESGKKYFEYAEKAGQLDSKLRSLFVRAPESEKKRMANIVIKYFKMHKIDVMDTISGQLYDILEKYGNMKFEGRKSKFAILER